jgi:retinol dehydrogenase 12
MDDIRLDKETALVTGGTDGIGKAIARRLALAGAEVFIVGSDPEKGTRAADELRAAAGHDRVHFMQADLGLVRDTDRLADVIKARIPRLHRLVLCAGVVRGNRLLTAEGIESNFAINYLSRFVLTERLMPLLRATGKPGAAARIVVIGGAAMNGTIHYDDINLTGRFGILRAVPQFCQANDLFVIEQARRLAERAGPPSVTITTLKAGVVRTNIRRDFPWWMKLLVPLVADPLLGQEPDAIAASAVRLLVDPAFEGQSGLMFTQIRRFKAVEPGLRTRDVGEGKRFWDFSARLTARARGELHPSVRANEIADKSRRRKEAEP